jgi:hypothetical protein
VKVEVLNILRGSSTRGIIWMLFFVAFTVKSCDFFFTYRSTFKCYNVENPDDETSDGCVKKGDKKFFSITENGITVTTIPCAKPVSVHWSIYSFSIFKEPLRDVLTPPPNNLFA